jgi:hypothetical protein
MKDRCFAPGESQDQTFQIKPVADKASAASNITSTRVSEKADPEQSTGARDSRGERALDRGAAPATHGKVPILLIIAANPANPTPRIARCLWRIDLP